MKIKDILDNLYAEYKYQERIPFDPIEFPHRYKNPEDIEVVAFIAACFSYGQVSAFKGILEKIFTPMGKHPYDFIINFNVKRNETLFRDIKYRFNNNLDIISLIYTLRCLLRNHKSLQKIFNEGYNELHNNIIPALTFFINIITTIDTGYVYGNNIKTPGYMQFFPNPSSGSACKRMNLFLRWMIRDKDIDFGLWGAIPKSKLIIPLDTHIARISRCLGLSKRRSVDMKMALEITETLKCLDPLDPVKYDFALCHKGISKICTAAHCQGCSLRVV